MPPSESGGKREQITVFGLQTCSGSWQDEGSRKRHRLTRLWGMASDAKSKKNPAAVALGQLEHAVGERAADEFVLAIGQPDESGRAELADEAATAALRNDVF